MHNKLHPLYASQLQKIAQHPLNRRLTSPSRKPRVRKLRGTQVWVCQDSWWMTKGFGNTPAEAYADWKQWQC